MCKWKGCNEPERHQGYCPTHWMLVKPHKKDTDVKEPYKIPRESKKRAKENRVDKKQNKEIIANEPRCMIKSPVCIGWAQGAHHVKGRIGKNLTDVKHKIPACNPCNVWVEEHPEEARKMGVSKSRLSKQ